MKEDITIRFMRTFATPTAKFFSKYSLITPNRVTIAGYLLTVLGSLILFSADFQEEFSIRRILLFLVGLCFWLSALFDCVDGQLARLKGITTKKGHWLDSVLEDGKGIPFFLALGFYLKDDQGLSTLSLLNNDIFTYNVWFLLFIMMAGHLWLNSIASYNTQIYNEPQVVSHGNYYVTWIFLILDLLDLFILLFTLGIIISVFWTFFEVIFLRPKESVTDSNSKT